MGWKKISNREISNFNKPKSTDNFVPKKSPINRNIDIRKMAEERATKDLKI